jgi:hypothetical protein
MKGDDLRSSNRDIGLDSSDSIELGDECDIDECDIGNGYAKDMVLDKPRRVPHALSTTCSTPKLRLALHHHVHVFQHCRQRPYCKY